VKQLFARPIKNLDQQAMGEYGGASQYMPIWDRSTWSRGGYGDAQSAALSISTVYACVRLLAESVAQLPLILYRQDGQRKDRATDDPLYNVLHDQPNPQMTSFVWRELLMSHLTTWGNHFSEKTYDSLGRLQLWPIRPDRMIAKYGADGQKTYTYVSPLGNRTELDPETIFHVPGLSSNGLVGYSPIALHRKTLALAETAQDYGTNFLANGARPAVVLSHPKTLSEGAIGRLAGQMDELRGSRNAGKTVVLEEGLTVTEVGVPPEDAQYIQTRKFQRQIIASEVFHVPPHMIGDLESGASYASIEQMSLEFVTYGLMPWLARVEQEIKAQLVPIDGDNLYAEFLVDGLLRADAKSRSEALAIRWQQGTLSADEWRSKENENPLPDGLGQQYFVPVNYAPVNPPPGEQIVAPATVRETVPTAPGAAPELVAVKSAEVRCGNGHLLAELATPPYRFTCRQCKTVTERSEEGAAPLMSVA
jgi:HK97 family phage portal protein